MTKTKLPKEYVLINQQTQKSMHACLPSCSLEKKTYLFLEYNHIINSTLCSNIHIHPFVHPSLSSNIIAGREPQVYMWLDLSMSVDRIGHGFCSSNNHLGCCVAFQL